METPVCYYYDFYFRREKPQLSSLLCILENAFYLLSSSLFLCPLYDVVFAVKWKVKLFRYGISWRPSIHDGSFCSGMNIIGWAAELIEHGNRATRNS